MMLLVKRINRKKVGALYEEKLSRVKASPIQA